MWWIGCCSKYKNVENFHRTIKLIGASEDACAIMGHHVLDHFINGILLIRLSNIALSKIIK